MIKISGSALLAATALPLSRSLQADEDETVSWSRFLDMCRELSSTQFEDEWNQDTYTQKVEDLMLRLRVEDDYITKFTDRYNNWSSDFPEIRSLHRETQFMVSLLEFEKDEVIPLHDHPDMTGVVLCTQGQIKVDHYDKLEEQSGQDLPLLQEERSLEMSSGDTAALTVKRGNIHTLHALEFTRMIDVFTPPYNRDRIIRSRYYKIGNEPYEDRNGVFEAAVSNRPSFPEGD